MFPEDRLSLHFHPEHWEDLAIKSGLTEETIKMGRVYSLAPRFISYFFKRSVPAEITSALVFPYQGGDFARIKIFPGLKTMRYVQPPGTSARLFMPIPVNNGPLIVCEGEKKTLAALQYRLNAVGIGGVWNWVSKGSPINDIGLIDWDGREVEIVPDSDAWERPDLMRAVYALGRELKRLGGSVSLVRIPSQDSEKVGLDDYFLQHGPNDFDELERVALGSKHLRTNENWYLRRKLRIASAKVASDPRGA